MIAGRSAPVPLRSWHPAALIATGLGLGLLPGAPGTWGSLGAVIVGWALRSTAGRPALAAAAGVAFFAGWWAAARIVRAGPDPDPDPDPGAIVIDEIAAQWLVLLVAPLDWRAYLAAFVLFRAFDIVKPWPIREAERRIAGGLGVMLDDILAAIYAVILLLIGEGGLGVRP